MKLATIYKIINIVTKDSYIGSTTNCYRRKYAHFDALSKNKHHSIILQRAYNKYGKDSFILIKINTFPYFGKADILSKEQYYIDRNKCKYNICKIAGSQLGSKRDIKFREICSQRMKGKSAWNKGMILPKHSEETKKKMSLSHSGKKRTVETKRIMSLKKKGILLSENHRKKLSEAKLRGTSINKPVISIDKNNNIVEFLGVCDAHRKTGVSIQTIYDSINKINKKWKKKTNIYQWMYKPKIN